MPICSNCQKDVNKYHIIKQKICAICYKKEYYKNKTKEVCVKCGHLRIVQKRINGGPIYSSCDNKYFKPKEECFICKEIKLINFRDPDNRPICKKCYCEHYQKKSVCVDCGVLATVETTIDNKPICKKCYRAHQPKHICSGCGENRPYKSKKRQICQKCYTKDKLKTNEHYNLIMRIRKRINAVFRLYSTTGKMRRSCEYGIDYEAIIKHLGPCPGAREDYHIDHIRPLILFDFDDLEQIKLAFAPENHQWLTKEENLRKGDRV